MFLIKDTTTVHGSILLALGKGPVHLTGGNHEVYACWRLDVLLLGRNELAFRYHLPIEDLVEFIKIDFGINRILTPSLVGSCSKRTISPNFETYPNPNPAAYLILVFSKCFSVSRGLLRQHAYSNHSSFGSRMRESHFLSNVTFSTQKMTNTRLQAEHITNTSNLQMDVQQANNRHKQYNAALAHVWRHLQFFCGRSTLNLLPSNGRSETRSSGGLRHLRKCRLVVAGSFGRVALLRLGTKLLSV